MISAFFCIATSSIAVPTFGLVRLEFQRRFQFLPVLYRRRNIFINPGATMMSVRCSGGEGVAYRSELA